MNLLCGFNYKEHQHAASLKFGLFFHIAYISQGFGKTFHNAGAQMGMGHFATAETNGNLYLIASLQELAGVVGLGIKIVGVNVQGKTNFLNVNDLLIFFGFLFTLGLFEAVLAVIQNLADRRGGLRSNLNKVKIFFGSNLQCFFGRHDAQLFAFFTYQTHFFVTDLLIDKQFFYCDGKTPPYPFTYKNNKRRQNSVRA